MMRQARMGVCPEWLYAMLHPPLFGAAPTYAEAPPTLANLNDGQFEASQRIRRQLHRGKAEGGGASPQRTANRPSSKSSSRPSSRPSSRVAARPGGAPFPQRPLEATKFSRETLLTIVDLLPSAEHVEGAQINGHGDAFGPFVTQELLWRLVTSTRTRLASLELANNALGDAGAVAAARAIGRIPSLSRLDLSGNGIGLAGATSLFEALRSLPEGCQLRELVLDDNERIPSALLSSIHTQLLANNLPAIVAGSRSSPRPPARRAAPEEAKGAGDHPLEQGTDGMDLPDAPAVHLQSVWLSHIHMPALRGLLSSSSAQGAPPPPLRALLVRECPRLTDAAFAALLAAPSAHASGRHGPAAAPAAAPPAHAYLHSLRWLRLTRSPFSDAGAAALCIALEGAHMRNLIGLALDGTQIALAATDVPPPVATALPTAPAAARGAGGGASGSGSAYPLATRLGAALRLLPTFVELDLSNNEALADVRTPAAPPRSPRPAPPSPMPMPCGRSPWRRRVRTRRIRACVALSLLSPLSRCVRRRRVPPYRTLARAGVQPTPASLACVPTPRPHGARSSPCVPRRLPPPRCARSCYSHRSRRAPHPPTPSRRLARRPASRPRRPTACAASAARARCRRPRCAFCIWARRAPAT